MSQIKAPKHEWYRNTCSYCGVYLKKEKNLQNDDACYTRDHVPSRIFLDKPFPENLPVVPCCKKCNHSFSKDEEYLACLIEVLNSGSTDIKSIKRKKVRNIFESRPKILERISRSIYTQGSLFEEEGTLLITGEHRIINVILKLIRGHIKYELSAPEFDYPDKLCWGFTQNLNSKEFLNFLLPMNPCSIIERKSPELGSRASLRTLSEMNSWITVQENNYTYRVEQDVSFVCISLILRGELYVEAVWVK